MSPHLSGRGCAMTSFHHPHLEDGLVDGALADERSVGRFGVKHNETARFHGPDVLHGVVKELVVVLRVEVTDGLGAKMARPDAVLLGTGERNLDVDIAVVDFKPGLGGCAQGGVGDVHPEVFTVDDMLATGELGEIGLLDVLECQLVIGVVLQVHIAVSFMFVSQKYSIFSVWTKFLETKRTHFPKKKYLCDGNVEKSG